MIFPVRELTASGPTTLPTTYWNTFVCTRQLRMERNMRQSAVTLALTTMRQLHDAPLAVATSVSPAGRATLK